MFEDSLVESQGRISTRSQWFAIGSFLAQATLLLLLILFPLFHPEALPRQSLERLLIAPAPPRATAPVAANRANAAPAHSSLPSLMAQIERPRMIPIGNPTPSNEAPTSVWPVGEPTGALGDGLPDGIPLGSAAPEVQVRPNTPKGPLTISSGVAAGQLLSPIQPIYPAIAKQARIQGIVMIEATISRQGTIENLQVVEGPAMLRQSAINAVAAARYRPFLLNGEPVEVQTSIRVIFSLGD